MKFERGHWELLPGMEAIYPLSVTDVLLEDDALIVSGYDRVVDSRWSFLHGSIITARFTSPMPNVLRVQLTHFKGRRRRLPAFDLDYEQSNPNVEIGRAGLEGMGAWIADVIKRDFMGK